MPEKTFSVWIVVEDDSTDGLTWWSVDHHHSREDAIAHAEAMAAAEYSRTGVEPQRLED